VSTKNLSVSTENHLVSTENLSESTKNHLVSTKNLSESTKNHLVSTKNHLVSTENLSESTENHLVSTKNLSESTENDFSSMFYRPGATPDGPTAWENPREPWIFSTPRAGNHAKAVRTRGRYEAGERWHVSCPFPTRKQLYKRDIFMEANVIASGQEKQYELFFEANELPRVQYLLETKQFFNLGKLKRYIQDNTGIKLRLSLKEQGTHATAQLFEYFFHAYEPVSPLMEFENTEAEALALTRLV
jgi:hypothetical protein